MKKAFINTMIVFLSVLFTYTAVSKLITFSTFQKDLGKSPLISDFSWVLAIMLPLVELILGFGLLFFKSKKWPLLSSFFLMLVFTGYIFIMLAFSLKQPCSCGGVIRYMTWPQHLAFNAIVTGLTWLAYYICKRGDSLEEENLEANLI